MCSQENLKPIPRNDSDYKKNRFSHFKFDLTSEEIITEWMKNNLALSFYVCPQNKLFIERLETEIIQELKPILNIDYKNPDNPYKEQIKQLRKNCTIIALKNSSIKVSNTEKKTSTKSKMEKEIFGTSRTGTIYIDNITKSDVKSRNIRITVKNKYLFPAEKIGNPISYSLNFKIQNTDFIAKYTIGSKDGKSRSGILKLEDKIYKETLKIQLGTNLKISRSKDNNYIVEQL